MGAELMTDSRQIAMWHANKPGIEVPKRKINIKFRKLNVNEKSGMSKAALQGTEGDILVAEGDEDVDDPHLNAGGHSWLDAFAMSSSVQDADSDTEADAAADSDSNSDTDETGELSNDPCKAAMVEACKETNKFMAESLVNIKSEKLLDVLSLNAREVANDKLGSSGTSGSDF